MDACFEHNCCGCDDGDGEEESDDETADISALPIFP